MKILLYNSGINFNLKIDDIIFVNDIEKADIYNYNQFSFFDKDISKKTIYIDKDTNVYCVDITKISTKYKNYFLLGNLSDIDIENKIIYYFENLETIALHNLTVLSNLISVNSSYLLSLTKVGLTNLFSDKDIKDILIKNDILSPDDLSVNEELYKVYTLLKQKLDKIGNISNQIFFEDFILSLLPFKYWGNSLFFLNSKLSLKIFKFFDKYEEVFSFSILFVKSKFLKDAFEALLLQTNKKFNIFIGVDGYNKKQKDSIVEIINKYKDKFQNIEFFVNRKNIGVGKTRWKLMNKDKTSKYIMFLDDDVFLSVNAIEKLYENIAKYKSMGIYSIANIDVKYNVDYRDYIHEKGGFAQPGVFTNRERVNRLPLYCDQEETPLIHDRFFSNLLDIKYNKIYNKNSIDMAFNRFLEIICGNINQVDIYQFNRIGHSFHQTREKGYDFVVFSLVIYLLKEISTINNNVFYYDFLIKTLVPKQNELFVND